MCDRADVVDFEREQVSRRSPARRPRTPRPPPHTSLVTAPPLVDPPRSAIRQHPILQAGGEQIDRARQHVDGEALELHARQAHIDWEPRSRVGNCKVRTAHYVHLLLYSLVPMVLIIEGGLLFARCTREDSWGTSRCSADEFFAFTPVAAVYSGIHILSHVTHTRPGRALRSFARSDLTPFVGSADQMSVPIAAYATYTIFWYVVLAAKLSWGYFVLIEPLVHPLKALWYSDEHCWRGDPAEKAYCALRAEEPADGDGHRRRLEASTNPYNTPTAIVLASLWRLLLIFVRCAVPLLVYFFDTSIFYTLFAALTSICVAVSRGIGRVASWAQMLRTFEEAVARFDAVLMSKPADDDDGDGDEDDDEEAGLVGPRRSRSRRLASARAKPNSTPVALVVVDGEARVVDVHRVAPAEAAAAAPRTFGQRRRRYALGRGRTSGVRGTSSAAACAPPTT